MTDVSLTPARAAFGVLALLAAALPIVAPLHGWDMVAYIGAARYYEVQEPAAVHQYAYDELRRGLSQEDYEKLVPVRPVENPQIAGDETYRAEMAQNPDAFIEQLSYYQIRPFYTFPVYLLTKLGVGAVAATHLVSGAAVAAGIVLLYFVCSAILPAPLVLLAAPLTLIFGVLDLARRASPDGLSFGMLMLLCLLLVRARTRMLLVALPLAIAARTDLVLFTFPLFLLLALRTDMPKKPLAASVAASFVMYFAVNSLWSNPGWGTTFYHGFIERQHYPVSAPATLALSQYLDVMVHTGLLGTHWTNRILLLYFLAAATSLYLIVQRWRVAGVRAALTTPAAMLSLAAAAYVAGHFVIFPVFWERYFSGAYMVACVAVLWQLWERSARAPQPTAAAPVDSPTVYATAPGGARVAGA